MAYSLDTQIHQQLPGYHTPAEIAEAVGRIAGRAISVYTILHGISGRRDSVVLFAYKSQGRYWIPEGLAAQFIYTGHGYPEALPLPHRRELPGYYTPQEMAEHLQVTSLTILHAVRGRPDRGKTPILKAFLAQNRYWIPEQEAEAFIRARTQAQSATTSKIHPIRADLDLAYSSSPRDPEELGIDGSNRIR